MIFIASGIFNRLSEASQAKYLFQLEEDLETFQSSTDPNEKIIRIDGQGEIARIIEVLKPYAGIFTIEVVAVIPDQDLMMLNRIFHDDLKLSPALARRLSELTVMSEPHAHASGLNQLSTERGLHAHGLDQLSAERESHAYASRLRQLSTIREPYTHSPELQSQVSRPLTPPPLSAQLMAPASFNVSLATAQPFSQLNYTHAAGGTASIFAPGKTEAERKGPHATLPERVPQHPLSSVSRQMMPQQVAPVSQAPASSIDKAETSDPLSLAQEPMKQKPEYEKPGMAFSGYQDEAALKEELKKLPSRKGRTVALDHRFNDTTAGIKKLKMVIDELDGVNILISPHTSLLALKTIANHMNPACELYVPGEINLEQARTIIQNLQPEAKLSIVKRASEEVLTILNPKLNNIFEQDEKPIAPKQNKSNKSRKTKTKANSLQVKAFPAKSLQAAPSIARPDISFSAELSVSEHKPNHLSTMQPPRLDESSILPSAFAQPTAMQDDDKFEATAPIQRMSIVKREREEPVASDPEMQLILERPAPPRHKKHKTSTIKTEFPEAKAAMPLSISTTLSSSAAAIPFSSNSDEAKSEVIFSPMALTQNENKVDISSVRKQKTRNEWFSKTDWLQSILHIRKDSKDKTDCAFSARSLLYKAMFNKDLEVPTPAQRKEMKIEDIYTYSPTVIIRNRAVISSTSLKNHGYYAAVKGNSLIKSNDWLMALLPNQYNYTVDDQGKIDLTKASKLNTNHYYAKYLQKDQLKTYLQSIVDQHGGWMMGTISLSAVRPLTKDEASHYYAIPKRIAIHPSVQKPRLKDPITKKYVQQLPPVEMTRKQLVKKLGLNKTESLRFFPIKALPKSTPCSLDDEPVEVVKREIPYQEAKHKIPDGHVVLFQYVSDAELRKKKVDGKPLNDGTSNLMIFEPQDVLGGNVIKGPIYNSLEDNQSYDFITQSGPVRSSQYDSFVTVTIFHSPMIMIGRNPEITAVKPEVAEEVLEEKIEKLEAEISQEEAALIAESKNASVPAAAISPKAVPASAPEARMNPASVEAGESDAQMDEELIDVGRPFSPMNQAPADASDTQMGEPPAYSDGPEDVEITESNKPSFGCKF